MEVYNCAQVILEIASEAYSLYYSVSEGFDREDLFRLIREQEVFNFSKQIEAKIIGFTIEKRARICSNWRCRIVEILEKSSFDIELIPMKGSLWQPTHHIGIDGNKIWKTKNCQFFIRLKKPEKQLIKVRRQRSTLMGMI